jgi:1-acyl-sn-glycerol-3-phosphate acyltransferase
MKVHATRDPADWRGINRAFQFPALQFCRFVRTQCLRQIVLHHERATVAGGCVLACTHVSHIEPMLVSCLVDRPVYWMARKEFYRFRPVAVMLRWVGAFSVNRAGVAVSSIRAGVRLAREGRIVGIFPEGGCVTGHNLMFRGGEVKQGACAIAWRAQVPILPVVVLGTDRLRAIDPWLPALQGRVWVAFGNPIAPPPMATRSTHRLTRRALAAQLQREFARTYHELLDHAGLTDAFTP